MTVMGNEGNSHAVVIDDGRLVHELSQQFQGTSPTPRSAAYRADLALERSQAFVELMKQLDLVSGTNSPVLLKGERGVGKELIATVIHHRSERSDRRLALVNCLAIPAELIEAQMFGSDSEGGGVFEQAEGGTVFLDEITQTTPAVQLRILRILQTGEITRVGSSETKKVNVRVMAASSSNFEEEVAAGRFSSDLFNTLNAVSIAIPPPQDPAESGNDNWVTLSVIEGRYVARVLEHTCGNKQAAARLLSVDRKTLDRMIKRHNINCQRVRALRGRVRKFSFS